MRELKDRLLASLLAVYDEREAGSSARMLIEEIWGFDYYNNEQQVAVSEDKLVEVLSQIERETPIQQIVGHAWFYDNKFKVSKNVLTPRPETEELVDWIIKDYKLKSASKVLDIGTGSGAIAITLALEMNGAEVSAIDISELALDVARENAREINVEVDFTLQDILRDELSQNYDIIVSNPPYITDKEMSLMRKNVLDYEPHIALFVRDNDPLIFYRRIAVLAIKYLNNGGRLYFEINENFGKECCLMLSEIGFSDIILRKDLNDRDRMIRAIK